jgi:hypothetical protein
MGGLACQTKESRVKIRRSEGRGIEEGAGQRRRGCRVE